MTDNTIFLPSSDDLNVIIDIYADNLNDSIEFNDEILRYTEKEIINGCEKTLSNINHEIKKLLIYKLLFIEKDIIANENTMKEIDYKVKNEISFNKNEIMKKMYDYTKKVDVKDFLESGYEIGLNDNKCKEIYDRFKDYKDKDNKLYLNGCKNYLFIGLTGSKEIELVNMYIKKLKNIKLLDIGSK